MSSRRFFELYLIYKHLLELFELYLIYKHRLELFKIYFNEIVLYQGKKIAGAVKQAP